MYIDITNFLIKKIVFFFFIGGRGVGKTFSALRYAVKRAEESKSGTNKFLFLRRTQTELEIAMEKNPFQKVLRSRDKLEIVPGTKKYIYDLKLNGKDIGSACALSTFANVRGADFNDFDLIVFDEFIPEVNARKVLRDEAGGFFNLIESVSRNREIEGLPPVQVILLANSNEIYNSYFLELDVVEEIEKALKEHKNIYRDFERMLQISILESTKEFVEKKSNTSLYKLTKNTKFAKMSLNNDFSYNNFENVKRYKTKGFKPFLKIDFCTIWKKKNDQFYYCSKPVIAKIPEYNTKDEIEKEIFKKKYKIFIYEKMLNNQIYFENYKIKRSMLDIFGIKT